MAANVLKTITGTVTGLGLTTIFVGGTCVVGMATKRLDDLKGEIKSNIAENAQLQAENAELKAENKNLEKERGRIANDYVVNKQDHIKLQTEYQQLILDNARFKGWVENLQSINADLYNRLVGGITSEQIKQIADNVNRMCVNAQTHRNGGFCSYKGNELQNLLGDLKGIAAKLNNVHEQINNHYLEKGSSIEKVGR